MEFKVIGLCGGSGSGKGVVSSIFARYGYLTIDTDMVYREITNKKTPCLDALILEFGDKILNQEGGLDRKKLGAIVFSDREKLDRLNAVSHKFVLDEVRSIIENAKKEKYTGALVDAPLLFESGFDSECDYVVAVVAKTDIRISRIIERDDITKEAAIKRIASQTSDEYLISKSDFVIKNNADKKALESEVKMIISNIK